MTRSNEVGLAPPSAAAYFEAGRTRAMEREERHDYRGATEMLTGVMDSLPEHLKEEARLAIKSLEEKLRKRGGATSGK